VRKNLLALFFENEKEKGGMIHDRQYPKKRKSLLHCFPGIGFWIEKTTTEMDTSWQL
jgi:hypothetical protein